MMTDHGRTYLAIPGPSVMPDRVLRAMMRPAPNIYTGPLATLVDGLIPDLRAVARTAHNVVIYIANGHAMWEAALANTVAPGQRILVLATGHFGHGWAEMAERLGIEAEILDFGRQSGVDADRLEARLRADTERSLRAVLVTHVDTATSVRSDIAAVRAAIDVAGHPALLMADCVASMGCERFEMDAWGVDLAITASQKGLMTPPGLGFIFFNDRAARARADMPLVSGYWDWVPRVDPEELYLYFAGTPPTHHLYALREALSMLVHEEGVEAAWARHRQLARAIWAAHEVWGQGGPVALNLSDPALRSHAVTAVSLDGPNGTALRDWVADHAGLTLGIGLGMVARGDPAWHAHYRIGHMGHLNAQMVMGMLGAIETGLQALNIPHGSGALDAAAAALARGDG